MTGATKRLKGGPTFAPLLMALEALPEDGPSVSMPLSTLSTTFEDTDSPSDDGLEVGPTCTIRTRTLRNAMNPLGSAKNDLCDMDTAVQAWGPELGIDPAELTTGRRLGRGSTAEVFEGAWQGRAVAVKRLPTRKKKMVSVFVRELGVMAKASHPNLVRLLGFCSDGSSVDVVLELCRGGSLFDMLHVSDVEISSRQQIKIASDVADAMTYLHGMDPPIMHRDLKSLNVLLLEPLTSALDVPTAKLTDFGLAKVRYSEASLRQASDDDLTRLMSSQIGTVQWTAPEMLAGSESYSAKVDVYAYGILLYEIWHFEPPFAELEAHEVEKFVLGGGRPPVDWKATPEPLVRLIDSCWAQQAKERPDFGAVAHSLRSLQGLHGEAVSAQRGRGRSRRWLLVLLLILLVGGISISAVRSGRHLVQKEAEEPDGESDFGAFGEASDSEASGS